MMTPKELMISRYEAFAREDWEYVANTSTCQTLEEMQTSPKVEWIRLDVLNDYDNIVEFKAYYKDGTGLKLHHERSVFTKVGDEWKYSDGVFLSSKIERNEPCPCGSGKKFKKCCA